MADDKPIPSRVKAIAAKLTHKPAASSDPPPSWVSYVAMLTGILAGTAGFLTVRATTLTNNAIYESNQAILEQAQASDSWNEYQADSIKARILETSIAAGGTALDPAARAALEAQDQDFRTRQPKTETEAKSHELARDTHLAQGQGLLATRDLISYADLATQLGIALASVAAMVHVRRAFDGAILIGGIGVAIAIYALGRQYLAGML
jgi:uncharacterized protein DUF4337